jgi:hypothetical protein
VQEARWTTPKGVFQIRFKTYYIAGHWIASLFGGNLLLRKGEKFQPHPAKSPIFFAIILV